MLFHMSEEAIQEFEPRPSEYAVDPVARREWLEHELERRGVVLRHARPIGGTLT
jgi:hypothetical protein